ncbi:hypothetical protein BC342_29135 [Streptomyces olivaceus]|nr:hypothetical protein BC342_29135 [Streptomyces olivaceus]
MFEHAGLVLDQLDAAVEGPVLDGVEGDIRIAVVDALRAVAPVITGNITTRKRSTSPARSRDRHRLMLPIVLSSPEPPDFMARTASTASSRTSVELAHFSGSSSEAENTTLDAWVSSSTDASSSGRNSSWPLGTSPAAKPDIRR